MLSGLQQDWDACALTMEGHSNSVAGVCFSPDGRCITSAGTDKKVGLWDAVTGSHLHTLEGHTDDVHCVAFSHDSKYIASGSTDQTIIIWDAVTGGRVHALNSHGGWVNTIDFSPSSEFLASGSDDGSIQLWDLGNTIGPIKTLSPTRSSSVKGIRFSRSGKLLISGSGDGACQVWKSGAWTCSVQYDHPEHTAIFSVAISPDDTTIALGLGGAARDILLHSAASGHRICTLQGHRSAVWSVDFSPNDTTLASCSEDHTIIMWDVESGAILHTLRGHSSEVIVLRYSPDGRRIASCGKDQSIRIWDLSLLATKSERQPARKKLKEKLIRGRGSSKYRVTAAKPQHSSNVRSVTFSPDGRILATGSRDTTICLWDTASGAQLWVLEGHRSVISYLSFSPDGRKLLSSECNFDVREAGTLRLWSVESGQCEQTLTGHERGVLMAELFADGKRAISCSYDHSIRVWEVGQLSTPGAELRIVYQDRSLDLCSVAVSPDGSLVAFGCWRDEPNDHTLGLISLAASQAACLVPYDRAYGVPTALVFSNDSSRLLVASSAGDPGRVTLWDIRAGSQAGSVSVDVAPEVTLLDCYDSVDSAESIAFSSTERCFVTDANMGVISPQHRPRSALQDNSPNPGECAFCLADNWLWYVSATERRRLCWVPPSFRLVRQHGFPYRGSAAVYRNVVAFGTEGGPVVIMDMTPCLPQVC